MVKKKYTVWAYGYNIDFGPSESINFQGIIPVFFFFFFFQNCFIHISNISLFLLHYDKIGRIVTRPIAVTIPMVILLKEAFKQSAK